jgi:hypothetical protein
MRLTLALLGLSSLLAGCAEPAGTPADRGAPGEASVTTAVEPSAEPTLFAEPATDEPTAPEQGSAAATVSAPALVETTLRGILVSETSEQLEGATVMACTARYCLYGETGEDGHFSFTMQAPVDVAIKTYSDPHADPPLGGALLPVRLTDATPVDVGEVYVPALLDVTPLGPESDDLRTVDAGDGVELTLRPADLATPLGEPVDEVSARAIRAWQIPAIDRFAPYDISALYALHPFGATSESPIAVRIRAGLPAGTEVTLHTISEIDGRLSDPIRARSDGEHIETAPGEGITELTRIVVLR